MQWEARARVRDSVRLPWSSSAADQIVPGGGMSDPTSELNIFSASEARKHPGAPINNLHGSKSTFGLGRAMMPLVASVMRKRMRTANALENQRDNKAGKCLSGKRHPTRQSTQVHSHATRCRHLKSRP